MPRRFRNQTQAISHRSSKRLHSGAIELDFSDLGFRGAAEVTDVWDGMSYGVHTDRYSWQDPPVLGSARFVNIRPVLGGNGSFEATGCSAWGGNNCSSAPEPMATGMFW